MNNLLQRIGSEMGKTSKGIVTDTAKGVADAAKDIGADIFETATGGAVAPSPKKQQGSATDSPEEMQAKQQKLQATRKRMAEIQSQLRQITAREQQKEMQLQQQEAQRQQQLKQAEEQKKQSWAERIVAAAQHAKGTGEMGKKKG